jgi:hypothetical protein
MHKPKWFKGFKETDKTAQNNRFTGNVKAVLFIALIYFFAAFEARKVYRLLSRTPIEPETDGCCIQVSRV